MSSKVLSAAIVGLDAEIIEVEADLLAQLPGMSIVGLPDKAIEESKERVKSAIKNSGFEFPRLKVTINLAPADLKKEGPLFDLPIALSILAASQMLPLDCQFHNKLFVGELALDGSLRPVTGILAVAVAAKKNNLTQLFLPAANATEAALISGIEIYPVKSLEQLVKHFSGSEKLRLYQKPKATKKLSEPEDDFDIAFVRGQEQVKRALEIAAAGGHNVLMSGPPGSGKTLLAKALSTILPDLTLHEALEVTKIHSVAGQLRPVGTLVRRRPFRHPHHTASGVSLVGGGTHPRPGEITLAHRGVLFLDEFPEFPRSVLENLRQPLEDGIITVSRAAGTLEFPAQFNLVAAMNPCPCGYLNDPARPCICTPASLARYQKRLSGPLMDRIDLHVEVARVEFEKLTQKTLAENSQTVRKRVQQARERQLARLSGLSILTNSEMNSRHVERFCTIDDATTELLRNAVARLRLSARSYHRILKIARTIADLAGQESISYDHVAEALQYRPKAE